MLRRFSLLWLALLSLVLPLAASAAGAPEAMAHAEEGLSAKSQIVFEVGPLAVTNSMVITVLVTVVLVVFAQLIASGVRPVPSGLQNFGEWAVESMYNFLGEILGDALVKKTFWFFGSLFFFILATNWIGLIPGVGTVGYGHFSTDCEFHIATPLLRGGNADLNMTSAMSVLFFVLWTVWALQANGPIGFIKHIFAPKGKTPGFMGVFLVLVFLFVGVLETVSILFRPISLSFRLYGNVFAGENILEAMMKLVPWLSWLIPLPFYFLELLVGLVQALVFTLLTAVFTLLICEHEHEPGEEGHDGASHH
jgi:F-type H+-transporting ATPase subunit a